MLKKLLILLTALVATVTVAQGQTYVYPALSTYNVFTGPNTFNNNVYFPALANQPCLGTGALGLLGVGTCGAPGGTNGNNQYNNSGVLGGASLNNYIKNALSGSVDGVCQGMVAADCINYFTNIMPAITDPSYAGETGPSNSVIAFPLDGTIQGPVIWGNQNVITYAESQGTLAVPTPIAHNCAFCDTADFMIKVLTDDGWASTSSFLNLPDESYDGHIASTLWNVAGGPGGSFVPTYHTETGQTENVTVAYWPTSTGVYSAPYAASVITYPDPALTGSNAASLSLWDGYQINGSGFPDSFVCWIEGGFVNPEYCKTAFSVDTLGNGLFGGNLNLASGKKYEINGTQISASNLSNGVSGTGAICLVSGSSCGGGGGGDTITSPNSTLTVGGTSTNTTLDVNLTHNFTWTGVHNFSGADLELPTVAGCGFTTAGYICYDSTNNRLEYGNGTNPFYIPFIPAGGVTSGGIVGWNGVVGQLQTITTLPNGTALGTPASGVVTNLTGTGAFNTSGNAGTATDIAGGVANDVPYQTAASTTAFVTPVNSAVMVTSAGGVPSESTTLPSGLTIPGYLTSSGVSGMTAGQVPIAASATTITSSEALAGSGAGITTGPVSGTTANHIVTENGTNGQVKDSGVLITAIPAADIAAGALANGMTATTQTVGDNTTDVATDAFVLANAGSGCANALTGNSSGGAAVGTTFNCSAPITFDYHTLGAAPAVGNDTLETSSFTAACNQAPYDVSNAGAQTITAPAVPATGNCIIIIKNKGAGTWTFTGSSNVYDLESATPGTLVSSATITTNQSRGITADGTNFWMSASPPTSVLTAAANTIVANVTSGSAAPTDVSIPAGIQFYTSGTGYSTATSANLLGVCTTCVTSASALTSTAIMTGGGSQASQTPSATATLSSSGNMVLPGTLTTGTAPAGTLGSGYAWLGTSGTEPTGLASTTNGFVSDSTANCPIEWANGANVGCTAAFGEVNVFTAANSFNSATTTFGVPGTLTGIVKIASSTATGSVSLTPASAASAFTATLPANTGTVPELNLVQSFTAAQTFTGGIINTTTPIRDQTRFVLVANMTAVATAGVNIGSTGASNVTFSWPVTAANWYDLECKLPVTFATTATIKFQLVSISGSSTISFVNSETMGNTGASAVFQDLYTNAGSSLATSTTPVTGAPGATEQITYNSQFLSSHAGNIGLEFIANGTNNVTMLEGGECGITQTN